MPFLWGLGGAASGVRGCELGWNYEGGQIKL